MEISLEDTIKILDIFSALRFILKEFGDVYRVEAYTSAMNSLQNTRSMDSFGASLRAKATEIIKTGKLAEYDSMEKIVDLYGIPGFGKRCILNILKRKVNVKEYLKNKKNFTEQQLLGLKYFKRLNRELYREDAKPIIKCIKSLLSRNSSYLFFTVSGSYRREKDIMKDIDILIVPESDINITQLIKDKLKCTRKRFNISYEATIGAGSTKFSFYIKVIEKINYLGKKLKKAKTWYSQVDFRYVTLEEYPSALLHFTGNKTFNIAIRRKAIALGYKLNEYGLWKNGKRIKLSTEKSILDKLKVNSKYYDPILRSK